MLRISAVAAVMLAFVMLGYGSARLLIGPSEVNRLDTTLDRVGGASPTTSPTMVTFDIPGADISGLPRFPGSIRIGFQQRPLSNLLQTQVTYLTAADLQTVHAFYREMIDTHGWKIGDLDFTTDERYFFLLNDDREATVHLRWTQPSVKVTLAVTELLGEAMPSASPTPTSTPTPATSTATQILGTTPTPTTSSPTSTPEPTSEPLPESTPTPTAEPALPAVPTEPPSEEPDLPTTAPTVDDTDDSDEDEDEDGDDDDE